MSLGQQRPSKTRPRVFPFLASLHTGCRDKMRGDFQFQLAPENLSTDAGFPVAICVAFPTCKFAVVLLFYGRLHIKSNLHNTEPSYPTCPLLLLTVPPPGNDRRNRIWVTVFINYLSRAALLLLVVAPATFHLTR